MKQRRGSDKNKTQILEREGTVAKKKAGEREGTRDDERL
jgi:hypothetical protein